MPLFLLSGSIMGREVVVPSEFWIICCWDWSCTYFLVDECRKMRGSHLWSFSLCLWSRMAETAVYPAIHFLIFLSVSQYFSQFRVNGEGLGSLIFKHLPYLGLNLLKCVAMKRIWAYFLNGWNKIVLRVKLCANCYWQSMWNKLLPLGGLNGSQTTPLLSLPLFYSEAKFTHSEVHRY